MLSELVYLVRRLPKYEICSRSVTVISVLKLTSLQRVVAVLVVGKRREVDQGNVGL